MSRKAKIQVVAVIVAVALANMSAGAHGALQQPQSRSGTTYYWNADGSSAGTSTAPSR